MTAAEKLADRIFVLMTEDNNHEFWPGEGDEHNRIAISLCSSLIGVVGEDAAVSMDSDRAKAFMLSAKNISAVTPGMSIADAMRKIRNI